MRPEYREHEKHPAVALQQNPVSLDACAESACAGPEPPVIFVDSRATRALYRELNEVGSACCPACAVLADVLERALLPERFSALLVASGVDLRRPVDVWGAPDEGFLQWWYPLVSTSDASALPVPTELHDGSTGISWFLTTHFPANGLAATPNLVAIEMTVSDSAHLVALAGDVPQ